MKNSEGLYTKYVVKKADGTMVDPDAKYFVLRYDGTGLWPCICREALLLLGRLVRGTNPTLAHDLQKEVMLESYNANQTPPTRWRFLRIDPNLEDLTAMTTALEDNSSQIESADGIYAFSSGFARGMKWARDKFARKAHDG